MAQNIGTLVGAAIRPIDDTMPIPSAYAFEINGGHHQVATLAARNSIIVERRQWGMLCTVYSDPTSSNNATYQLKRGNYSTVITDNQNWVVFSGGSGSSGAGSSAWQTPVSTITGSAPLSPVGGSRYLVGKNNSSSLSGAFASLTNPDYVGLLVGGFIAEYDSGISGWKTTLPYNGMTVKVNDEDDTFYRYEGTYPSGQWTKERVNQIRAFSVSSANQVSYTATVGDFFTYSTEALYLIQFATSNSGNSATININGLGAMQVFPQGAIGTSSLSPSYLKPGNIYRGIYDGSAFRVESLSESSGGFPLKYRIVPDERIYVPPYAEYFLYGDLEVNGTLDIDANGKVVILNGGLNLNGGTVSNYHRVEFVNIYGIPAGGSPGQVLYKVDSTDYSVGWTASGSVGAGATPSLNQVLGVGNTTIDKNIAISSDTYITGNQTYISLGNPTYSNSLQLSAANVGVSYISNNPSTYTYSVIRTKINNTSFYEKCVSIKYSEGSSPVSDYWDLGFSSGLGIGEYATSSTYVLRGTLSAYAEKNTPSYVSYAHGATIDITFKVDKNGTITRIGGDIVEHGEFSTFTIDIEVTAGQDIAPSGTDLVLRVLFEGSSLTYSLDFRYVILKTSFNAVHDLNI